jgi:uncharacterized membrane protein
MFTLRLDDLTRFGVPEYAITTTTLGGLIGPAVSYPAASFLVYVPVLALGIHDVRWVSLAAELVCLAVLAAAAPVRWKLLAVLVVLANVDMSVYGTAGGRTDWLWVAPCLLMIVSLTGGRVKTGAVLFGLAAAMKQQPWLLAPFLLVWLYHSRGGTREDRLRRAAVFCAVAGATFAAINLPFIVLDPASWLRSVAAPALELMIPHGQGLSLLTQLGLLNLGKSGYGVLAGVSLVVLVVVYAVGYRRMPAAVWILPAFVLWFSYRSYQDYFLYWIPLLVLGLLVERRRWALD